ncbi:MAG: serine/threonine protein kinase [Spirulina sp.]
MNALHRQDELIADRYQIVTLLGQGGMGATYAAVDRENHQRVAIKIVSLRQVQDWKILELFEREAKILASLNHPNIPNYLNYFHQETESDCCFYLVQELVEGTSLATLIAERNWQPDEEKAKYIATQILKILKYLHSFCPPVIHRDITPQNIIYRDDGKVYLVDFGAVQEVYRNTLSFGETFVGTLGYSPLEQFRGQVSPLSDLYSLGCTLLFMLTRRSPMDLPQKQMRFEFRDRLSLSPEFADWLAKMVEPTSEDRFSSAEAALTAIHPKSTLLAPEKSDGLQPQQKRFIIERTPRSLSIVIPQKYKTPNIINLGDKTFLSLFFRLLRSDMFLELSAWIFCRHRSSKKILCLLVLIGGGILSNLSVLIFYMCGLDEDLINIFAPIIFVISSLGIIILFFLGENLKEWTKTELNIQSQSFQIKQSYLSGKSVETGNTKNITLVDLEVDAAGRNFCVFWEGDRDCKLKQKYRFNLQLNKKETMEIIEEISDFLKDL